MNVAHIGIAIEGPLWELMLTVFVYASITGFAAGITTAVVKSLWP